jgi:hypothetical protein
MKIAGVVAPPKEWAWSYSKLKNYETCPKRHYEVDITKAFSDAGGEALVEGNQAHDALAKACSGQVPLPTKFSHYQAWVDRIQGGTGELLVEQKYAITRDFRPTTYFARDVWFRGIGDIVRINGRGALVIDWKTGKIVEEPVQLALMAACIFAHYPSVEVVRSEFVWLREECSTPELFKRSAEVKIDATIISDVWVKLLPRVATLEKASQTLTYPPKPGGLCKKYCPVTSCPYWGKGAR